MEAVDFRIGTSHAIIAPIMEASISIANRNNNDNPIALQARRAANGRQSTC
jgi:hypothetical protein